MLSKTGGRGKPARRRRSATSGSDTERYRELPTVLADRRIRLTKTTQEEVCRPGYSGRTVTLAVLAITQKRCMPYLSQMVFDPTDTARLDSNLQGRTAIDPLLPVVPSEPDLRRPLCTTNRRRSSIQSAGGPVRRSTVTASGSIPPRSSDLQGAPTMTGPLGLRSEREIP